MRTPVILCLLVVAAQLARADLERDQHVQYELLADVEKIAPGEPFTVALRMLHDEDWHTYWKQPGIAGIPTQLKWDLPAGFKGGSDPLAAAAEDKNGSLHRLRI